MSLRDGSDVLATVRSLSPIGSSPYLDHDGEDDVGIRGKGQDYEDRGAHIMSVSQILDEEKGSSHGGQD
jgi:hypothetical protein